MGEWVSISSTLANSPVVETLKGVQGSMHGAVATLKIVVGLAKTIADLLVKFAVDVNDIQAMATKVAVEAMRAALKELENAPAVYALPVSIVETGLSLASFGGAAGVATGYLEMSDGTKKLLSGSGGNAGFYKTVAASLADALDDNKPTFDSDSYVGGTFILFGATTFYEITALLLQLQELLRGAGVGDGLNLTNLPRPRREGLKLSVTAPTKNIPYAVKLSWPSMAKGYTLPEFGDASYNIRDIVIYRSTGRRPLPGVPSSDYQIDRFTYTGFETQYYDEELPDDAFGGKGIRVHYYMGYALTEVHADGTTKELEPLSVVCKSKYLSSALTPRPTTGVPPDWTRANLFDLIPELKTVFVYMNRFLDELEANAQGGSSQIKAYVASLNALITKYTNFINELLAIIDRLIDLLTLPQGYVGNYFFGGKGGNAKMLEELHNALTDVTDPLRPPFDTGTEAVGGLVLYTGAPTFGEVQKALGVLQMLLGGSMDAAAATARAINEAVEDAERQVCVNDELIRVLCQEIESPGTVLGADLQPASANPDCDGG